MEIEFNNLTNILTLYKQRLEEILKRKLVENDNVATGNLLASINTKLEINDSVYEVWLNTLDYLKYIENGRKPGKWPPSEPILKWIRSKRLPTEESTGDKSLPTEKQLTYLVQRKIGTEGIQPKPNYAETIEELNEEYLPLIENALREDFIANIILIEIFPNLNIGMKM